MSACILSGNTGGTHRPFQLEEGAILVGTDGKQWVVKKSGGKRGVAVWIRCASHQGGADMFDFENDDVPLIRN